jgi:hypothetical protein
MTVRPLPRPPEGATVLPLQSVVDIEVTADKIIDNSARLVEEATRITQAEDSSKAKLRYDYAEDRKGCLWCRSPSTCWDGSGRGRAPATWR